MKGKIKKIIDSIAYFCMIPTVVICNLIDKVFEKSEKDSLN
jgi:hypothetical protein